ncbi:MAG: N-6 DNA methylase [Opitutales bacterium]|nr:N-6 DNA methylase [Opitutales bacterium]
MIPDYITLDPVKETPKEKVRQEIARALIFEYQIAPESMERDFSINVEGKRKKVDIAIFEAGQPHEEAYLRRVVVCRPEPKQGKKGVTKIRDFKQAGADLEDVKGFMLSVDACEWGLWTNGLERFFIRKKKKRFETLFDPYGDWPPADGTMGSPDVYSDSYERRAKEVDLKRAFRRCHNFIHGNEGMPKDAAFWQFLYLIFAKMHDERLHNGGASRLFFAHPKEPFEEEGRMKIRQRIDKLFAAVKQQYRELFKEQDALTLSDKALAYMVMELSRYNLSRSDIDAKGAAYQEIVGANLRGDRGQYFTPRRAVDLVIEMLDPKPHETLLDSACGTGGFLVAALKYQARRFTAEYEREIGDDTTDDVLDRLRDYAEKHVYGADFDPFLVRASTMNVMMAANTQGNLFHMDSLAFPRGHLPGKEQAKGKINFGTIDVLVTNPPFGSDIPITDPEVLEGRELARVWRKDKGGNLVEQDRTHNSLAPEILFIEQNIKWLKEGGRMGIVLPNGILGNPGDESIRRWILKECWVLACVEVPVEAFIVEANVGILTSLLFLKKKTEDEKSMEAMGHKTEYPIFMAVAEKAGVDRRGNPLYKRHPDGSEIVEEKMVTETVKLNGKTVTRQRRIIRPVIDDDFPLIAAAYKEFRKDNPEPGA